MHTTWCNRRPALFPFAASRSRLDAVTRAATPAPTVRVDTKRTPGAGLWPGGIRRERTNDNRDRFYLTRRAAVLAAGQAGSVDLPWSGRSRTGKYLPRAKHGNKHRRGCPPPPKIFWGEP